MTPKFSICVFFLTGVILAAYSSSVNAYETYTDESTYVPGVPRSATGNCQTCHGGNYHNIPYVSVVDGATWTDYSYSPPKEESLHGIHELMVNADCDVCHVSSGRYPTYLNASNGSNGFNIGCLGCHGRSETASGGQVTGAGLRQRHWNTGTTICSQCHSDADPASFTPVGENVLPPYYSITPDPIHPNKPTDPCNPSGEENFAGTAIGLDNDGDGFYDQSDSNCRNGWNWLFMPAIHAASQ